MDGKFQVHFLRKVIVKSKGPFVAEESSHILSLSNLDLLSGRFPVTYLYFYSKTSSSSSSSTFFDNLKDSLSECLNFFYPFSGKIVQNKHSNEPEILCNNSGVLLIEAKGNIPLKDLDFYNLDHQILKGNFLINSSSIDQEFPLQVQITHFTCGGLSMAFTFDHALGDATSFGKFLLTWSEIARKSPVSSSPDHRRNLLRARNPPIYNSSLDQTFISCTLQEILAIPTFKILLKRLYFIDASSIDMLQKLASLEGKKRTKIEAFSAYIWKIMANTVDKSHKQCKMGWLIDGRRQISKNKNDGSHNNMLNYIGNVLSVAFGEGDTNELKEGSLNYVAELVHNSIIKVTKDEDHFLDLIDWIEWHRPGLMLSKNVLGKGGPAAAIVVSSGRRFPIAEIDFGFGNNPILGTVCSTIEKIGVGYINQRESGRGDGSWIVSVILWPQMVEALESHSQHVFQPMNSQFLHL